MIMFHNNYFKIVPMSPSITMDLEGTLINLADEMKREAHGTQQPRHINKIGEGGEYRATK
ncbi:MAG: hypothetical protein A4S08_04205 [Proteobacteria bacterium SG_bin4]|nr:MAG: hypothetical protein A4S08_04205 [Proteobacteria bacterium SG_bin4]